MHVLLRGVKLDNTVIQLTDVYLVNVATKRCLYTLCDKAAGQGHLNVIGFLLSNGADTSLVDNADQTARDVAVRFRQLAAIRLLSPNIGQHPLSASSSSSLSSSLSLLTAKANSHTAR